MTNKTPIRVMIVDDHQMVRDGLKLFLYAFEDLELVGEASNGAEALQRCADAKPDIVLMDLVMPDMDGPAATQAIRQQFPHTQIIALTSFPDESLVQKALQAGAISYLLKNVKAEVLADAIRSAHAGQPTLAPEAAEALIHAATQPAKRFIELTQREQTVLALLIEGLSNAEIAERLTISLSTARYHVGNILSKLGAANRAEAVAVAIKHDLVD